MLEHLWCRGQQQGGVFPIVELRFTPPGVIEANFAQCLKVIESRFGCITSARWIADCAAVNLEPPALLTVCSSRQAPG